jgi:hypothetical protein
LKEKNVLNKLTWKESIVFNKKEKKLSDVNLNMK